LANLRLLALRENKDVLLNTMGVFINEPLLDWQKLARRLAKEQAGGEVADVVGWFPKQKIDIACRKLEGDNPAFITESELSESVTFSRVSRPPLTCILTVCSPRSCQNPPCLKALKEIVRGSREHNIRARVGARCSSVKEQVDCLLDQATDPNILGRTYFGWAPFI
jgi:DNA-dependent protein kinase catalytic subunit